MTGWVIGLVDLAFNIRYGCSMMRTIGGRMPVVSMFPSADALRVADVHLRTGQALARFASTGLKQGVYRFKSHEEAYAQKVAGVVWVLAQNSRLRRSAA